MKLRKYGQINGDKMKKRITLTLILSTTKLTKDLFLQNLSESLKVIFFNKYINCNVFAFYKQKASL